MSTGGSHYFWSDENKILHERERRVTRKFTAGKAVQLLFIQDDESDANLSSDGHDDQSWMPDNPENEFMQLQNMQYTVDDNEDYFDNLPLSISQRIEVHREDDNFAFNAVPDFDEPTLNQSPLLSTSDQLLSFAFTELIANFVS